MKKIFVTLFFLTTLAAGSCLAQNNTTLTAEIRKEINLNRNATIRINNESKNIEIKSWKEDKITVVVSGIVQPENEDIDDLLDKLGISVRQLGNNVTISIKQASFSNFNSDIFNGNAAGNTGNTKITGDIQIADNLPATGNTGSPKITGDIQITGNLPATGNFSAITPGTPDVITGSNGQKVIIAHKGGKVAAVNKHPLTIYVPQSGKLRIDSKYGNLTFTNTIDDLDLDITNGNVEAEDINDLKLISKYGNFTCGDIKSGSIDFINGRFTANNTGEMDLDTKYSSIELNSVKNLSFISTNDEYEIDEAGEIKGRKNYGNFRIDKLSNTLELDGTNADIKIRNLSSSLSSIKVNDKYADLRLPLKNVKNYAFEVTGTYNTVYSFSDADGNKDDTGLENAKVKGTAGDGNGAKINIKCQNCTIDFK
jgi:hypothetical protein